MIDGYLKGNSRGSMPSVPKLLALAKALPATLEELTGLEAFHGAESKLPELTPDDLRFGKFYKSLPDGDPLKEYLRKMIEQQSDTGKEGPAKPK